MAPLSSLTHAPHEGPFGKINVDNVGWQRVNEDGDEIDAWRAFISIMEVYFAFFLVILLSFNNFSALFSNPRCVLGVTSLFSTWYIHICLWTCFFRHFVTKHLFSKFYILTHVGTFDFFFIFLLIIWYEIENLGCKWAILVDDGELTPCA